MKYYENLINQILIKLMIIIVLILFAISLLTFPTGAYFKSEYQVDVELTLESPMIDNDKQQEDFVESLDESDRQPIEDEQGNEAKIKEKDESDNAKAELIKEETMEDESNVDDHTHHVEEINVQEEKKDESGVNESAEH